MSSQSAKRKPRVIYDVGDDEEDDDVPMKASLPTKRKAHVIYDEGDDEDDDEGNDGGDDDSGSSVEYVRSVPAKRKREEVEELPSTPTKIAKVPEVPKPAPLITSDVAMVDVTSDSDDDLPPDVPMIIHSPIAAIERQVVPDSPPDEPMSTAEEAAFGAKLEALILNVLPVTTPLPAAIVTKDASDSARADKAALMSRKAFEEATKQAQNDAAALPLGKQPATVVTPLLPFQLQGLEWLSNSKRPRLGAILADDMGLGKTLQAIAYVAWAREHALRQDRMELQFAVAREYKQTGNLPPYVKKGDNGKLQFSQQYLDSRKGTLKPSLIVCPTSLVGNWKVEIRRHCPSLSVQSVEAASLATREFLNASDVIVMTYGQLVVAFNQSYKATKVKGGGDQFDPLGQVHPIYNQEWVVIVLDEAHMIKSAKTRGAACQKLGTSKFRLCLTGTPIPNSLMDLYPLLSFAKADGLGTAKDWKMKYASDRPLDPYTQRALSDMLTKYLLRRTKHQRINGQPILTLPPIKQRMVKVQMPLVQSRIYHALQYCLIKTVNKASQTMDADGNRLAFTAALAASVRLLCTAEHAASPLLGLCNGSWAKTRELLKMARYPENNAPAAEAFEAKIAQVVADYTERKKAEKGMTSEEINKAKRDAQADDDDGGAENADPNTRDAEIQAAVEVADSNLGPPAGIAALQTEKTTADDAKIFFEGTSAKFDALIKALDVLLTTTQEKVVIFSSYVTTLTLLGRAIALRFPQYKFKTLTGKDSGARRTEMVGEFQTDPDARMFLVSMMAGGVGLTLTAANHVYILSMWHNWTIHQQAIDRVYRISQKKDVTAINFYCDHSIDMIVAATQQIKRNIARDALQDETVFNIDDKEVLALISPSGKSLRRSGRPRRSVANDSDDDDDEEVGGDTGSGAATKLGAADYMRMIQYF
jgi:SNF2 family DNA or RNA helicase